jgi:hypothetical protein
MIAVFIIGLLGSCLFSQLIIRVPLTISSSTALTTLPFTLRHHKVISIERMPFEAVGLPGGLGCWPFTPKRIDLMGDWLQVVRVYADASTASMIWLKTLRDWANMFLIRNNMSAPIPPYPIRAFHMDLPISIREGAGHPIPASGFRIDLNMGFKPNQKGYSHQGSIAHDVLELVIGSDHVIITWVC